MLRSFCASLLLVLGATGGSAQPGRADAAAQRIGALLAPRIATREANGTVLVFRNGVQVYRRDVGMADFPHHVPIRRGTVFRIASLSKTVTGGAAVLLRTEQRLRFPAPLADYLPDFPRAGEIRVFHLLAHSSGLGDVPDAPAGHPYGSIADAVDAFRQQPLAFAPGTGNRYSNAGYVLAARLIEVASAQPYDRLLDSRLFGPLGMASARESLGPAFAPGAAHFYYPGGGRDLVTDAGREDMSSAVGAGALEMNADDLMRWLEAVRTRRLFDIWSQEYPWGWGKRTYFGLNAIEQSGRNAGYTGSILIIPDRQLSVLCLFNTQSGFGLRCATAVAAALLDQPAPEPSLELDLPRIRIDPAAAAAVEGTYVGNGWTLRVARRQGGLFYSWSGQRWMPLTPASAHRFLMLSDSAMLTVAPDAAGRIDRIAYRDGSTQATLTRSAGATAPG